MVSEVLGVSVLLPFALAFVLGSRHGFDWDHLTAIMDITSMQNNSRKSVALGFLYAVGHASVVIALGLTVLLFGIRIPVAADLYGGLFVGVTLVFLGIYISFFLIKYRDSEFRIKTRITIVANGILYIYGILRNRLTGQSKRPPQVFSKGYRKRSALVVGMVHGVGAETPSQIAIFSVGLGLGVMLGTLALVIFVAGLLVANTIFALFSSSTYRRAFNFPKIYRYVAAGTAALSLIIGITFLTGLEASLPAIIPD